MRRFLRPMGSSVSWCFLARWWIGSYEKGEAGRGKREEYNKPGTALTLPPSRVPLPQGSSAAPQTLPHAQPPWPLAPPPPPSAHPGGSRSALAPPPPRVERGVTAPPRPV